MQCTTGETVELDGFRYSMLREWSSDLPDAAVRSFCCTISVQSLPVNLTQTFHVSNSRGIKKVGVMFFVHAISVLIFEHGALSRDKTRITCARLKN